MLIVTGHFPANLGICLVNFFLWPKSVLLVKHVCSSIFSGLLWASYCLWFFFEEAHTLLLKLHLLSRLWLCSYKITAISPVHSPYITPLLREITYHSSLSSLLVTTLVHESTLVDGILQDHMTLSMLHHTRVLQSWRTRWVKGRHIQIHRCWTYSVRDPSHIASPPASGTSCHAPHCLEMPCTGPAKKLWRSRNPSPLPN